MTPRPRSTRTTRSAAPAVLAAAALVAALALAVVLPATPAGAHDGPAIVDIEAAHPAGGTQVHYIVRVTWEDDGHPAEDATVTATAVGGDGAQLTPVALAPVDSDGRYAGVVEYPAAGSWTVRVTSIKPTGSAEQAQEVAATPVTEPGDGDNEVSTGDGDGTTDSTDAGGGFAPADDGTGSDGDEQAAAAGSDDGGMPLYLIIAAAAVVLIGAATAVNIIRRNSAGPGTTAAEAGADPTGDDGSTPGPTGADASADDDDGTGAGATTGPEDGGDHAGETRTGEASTPDA